MYRPFQILVAMVTLYEMGSTWAQQFQLFATVHVHARIYIAALIVARGNI